MDKHRDPTVPDLRPTPWLRRINLRGQARLLLVTIPFTIAIGWWGSRANEDCAKGILEDTLGVPSSARYISFDMLAKEDHWRMQRVVFEVGDSRHGVCLTYRLEDGQYKWRRNEGVRDCDTPPSAEEIALLKRLNGWPGVATASAD